MNPLDGNAMLIPQQNPAMNPFSQFPFMQQGNNINSAQQTFSPELFQMYMQMNNQANMGMTGTGLPAQTAPSMYTPPPNQAVEDRDSGNDTMSPQFPQAVHSHPNSAHASAHNSAQTSPQFPGIPETSQQQFPYMTSPYAINNLLGSSSTTTAPVPVPDNRSIALNIQKSQPGRKRKRVENNESNVYHHQIMTGMPGFPNTIMNNQCKVCGDHASGYHYGVESCEGCKAFFRRTVLKNTELECSKGENCSFTFENCMMKRGARTSCAACRYKRCIELGMKKDSVCKPGDEKVLKKSFSTSQRESVPSGFEELLAVLENSMPTDEPITSKDHAEGCIRRFLHSAPGFDVLIPNTEVEMKELVSKLFPGLMTIRIAFSLDTVPFFTNEDVTEKVEKLRSGIRSTVLQDEGLASLSAIHALQVMTGGAGKCFDMYCKRLRQHIETSRIQEKGTGDRLLAKLGLLI